MQWCYKWASRTVADTDLTAYKAEQQLEQHAGMTGDRRLPRQTIQNAALKNPGESPVKGGREFTAGVEFNQQLVDLCVLMRLMRAAVTKTLVRGACVNA